MATNARHVIIYCMFKYILMGLGLFAMLFSVLIFSGKIPIGKNSNTQAGPTGEVVVWGTLPQDTVNNILSNLNIAVKTYKVSYQEIPESKFENVLVNNLANGTGPDLILAPYQIILRQTNRIYPFPYASLSEKTYKDNYVDGASVFLTSNGALALPVSVEPMVLFFNRSLLSKHAVINPPQYWDEITTLTPSLTVKDKSGNFIESAISFGTANNDSYPKDLLMAIVSQLGQIPVVQSFTQKGASYEVLANTELSGGKTKPLTDIVRYYTQFSDPAKQTYTWNYAQPNAQDAFVAERLAMYVGYSSEQSLIAQKNQKINFDMTYLPQTKGAGTVVTGMKLYGIATLKQSKLLSTALTAESALATSPYGPQMAQSVSGMSPIKAISQADQNISEVAKRSSLVARGWYDVDQNGSSNLFYTMIQDVVSGRKDLNDAVDDFVNKLSDLYNG